MKILPPSKEKVNISFLPSHIGTSWDLSPYRLILGLSSHFLLIVIFSLPCILSGGKTSSLVGVLMTIKVFLCLWTTCIIISSILFGSIMWYQNQLSICCSCTMVYSLPADNFGCPKINQETEGLYIEYLAFFGKPGSYLKNKHLKNSII